MCQLGWCVMFRAPDTKFIHILVEKFGTTWISALDDMEYSFIRSLATGTDVFDCFVPFRQKSVDSTAFGYMF